MDKDKISSSVDLLRDWLTNSQGHKYRQFLEGQYLKEALAELEAHSPLNGAELLIRAQERAKVVRALVDVESQIIAYEGWLKSQHPPETRARMRR